MPIEITCIICGAKRITTPNRAKIAKFCSVKCHDIYQVERHRVIKVCPQCGISFPVPLARNEKRVYCSTPCKKLACKKKMTKICPQCGDPFDVYGSQHWRKFCTTDCRIEFQRLRKENKPITPPSPKVRKKAVITPLGYASLVLFCFKRRTSYQGSYRERCKTFLILARDAGWKGSIVKALQRKEPKWVEVVPV